MSSAEWILETPSACNGNSICQVLPLADFGQATISGASTTTTRRVTGPISDREPGAGPANRVGDGRHRLVLADDAVVEALLHVQQARLLPLQHLVDGDSGPLRDDRRDVFLGHLLAEE